MNVKKKEWSQYIPRNQQEVWDYFSRPENLNELTPSDMSFEILSDIKDITMYQGMIIQYKICPFWGIKMNWVTEITHIVEGAYFVDEQRFGPYSLWHHQHHFIHQNEGTLMKDILHYKVPYSLIGTIADQIFVSEKIDTIFTYRQKRVKEIFC